jgi:alpha-D-ribose 1-methylphosphonate 5-triphosphate diphosphatase
MATGPTLLHNKIHLRFELSGIKAYEECLALLEGGSISLLSVMDHTPGQGQFNKTNFKAHVMSQGKTESEFEEELAQKLSRPKVEGEQLSQLIDLALELGIPVASHDDDSIEKVDSMLAMGVQICEFPITMEAAIHASNMGMHVAGGASNVLRGGSLSGNLNIAEAVTRGAVGILCSDYYPASILHSIFRLHRYYGLTLPEATNLASLHPARATGMDSFTGSLEQGKQADLLVIQLRDDIPMVTHAMVSGSMVMQTAHK